MHNCSHLTSVGAIGKVQRKVGVFPKTRLWIRTSLGCDVLHARLRTSRRRHLRPKCATWTWHVPTGFALHQKQWPAGQFGCLWITYAGKKLKNTFNIFKKSSLISIIDIFFRWTSIWTTISTIWWIVCLINCALVESGDTDVHFHYWYLNCSCARN